MVIILQVCFFNRNIVEFKSFYFYIFLISLIIFLKVFAPNLAAEFWESLKNVPKLQPKLWRFDLAVHEQEWPLIDKDALIEFVISVKFFEY